MSQLNVNQMVDSQGGVLAPISSVMRNRIINGAMTIDQRNAGAAVTVNNGYPVDRFPITHSSDGAFSAQQDSSAPAGFTKSTKITITTADASIGATQVLSLRHFIEGNNVSDLGWGTADAKPVTLSFWVRSSVTGTFGGSIGNSASNRYYAFSYNISSANTWEYKTVTIAGDTSGTWLTDSGIGVRVYFTLTAGSDRVQATGSWETTAGFIAGATGQVQLLTTLNATWQVTGVQLEKGTQATSFEYRQYGQELALCQRYYQEIGTAAANEYIYTFYGLTGATYFFPSPLPVAMRAAPTATVAGTWGFSNVSSFTLTASSSAYRLNIVASATGNITVQNNGSGSKLTFAIEL